MNTKRFTLRSASRFAAVLAALAFLIAFAARAEGPDDKYLNIVSSIDLADSMNANGQVTQARAKYLKAQTALLELKRDFPLSNPKAVAYRLNYVADKIAATAPKATATPGDATTSTASSHSAKNPATTSTGSTSLKLLADGAEPRKVLRLHPTAGDKQSLNLLSKISMTMTMGDAAMPAMKLPTTQMSMDLIVKNIAANGDITYDVTISDASVVADPEVLPQVADAMKATLGQFRGVSGAGTLSDRGISLRAELNIPADADPQTRQTLEQMKETLAGSGAAFPEEAVGPGARWEVSKKLKSQGMTIDQTVTYELVSNEDGRVSLKNTITQNAVNQKIQSPSMPGMKVDLSKMTGTGTGTTSLDLTKLMPTESNMEEHAEMAMSVNMGGQKQSLTTKTDSTVQLGSN